MQSAPRAAPSSGTPGGEAREDAVTHVVPYLRANMGVATAGASPAGRRQDAKDRQARGRQTAGNNSGGELLRNRRADLTVSLVICAIEAPCCFLVGLSLALGHLGPFLLPLQYYFLLSTLLSGFSLITTVKGISQTYFWCDLKGFYFLFFCCLPSSSEC